MVRLIPKDIKFFDMFAEMASNLGDGARLLKQTLEDFQDVDARVQQLKDIEHRGDDMTHNILTKLNQTFITPFDREDIYRLASSLDDVIDAIEEAADHIVLYRLGDLPSGMTAQCNVLSRAAKATVAGMSKLTTMNKLQDYTIEVNSLEDEADKIYRRLVADLLAPEDGVPTPNVLTVLKLKEVV